MILNHNFKSYDLKFYQVLTLCNTANSRYEILYACKMCRRLVLQEYTDHLNCITDLYLFWCSVLGSCTCEVDGTRVFAWQPVHYKKWRVSCNVSLVIISYMFCLCTILMQLICSGVVESEHLRQSQTEFHSDYVGCSAQDFQRDAFSEGQITKVNPQTLRRSYACGPTLCGV